MEKSARKREEEIDKEFKVLKPSVLGHIFDILAKVLKYKQDHLGEKILEDFPRMADFAENGEIISRCLGYKENQFIDAYWENINKQNDEVIEASPVAEALILFSKELDKDYWEGTPTELYNRLESIIVQIKSDVKRSNMWPKASNKLTSKINEVVPNQKEKGIVITTGEKNTRGDRIIKIEKTREDENGEANKINKDGDDDYNKLFNPHIHRRGNYDIFECDKCSLTDDIHFMKQHVCSKK